MWLSWRLFTTEVLAVSKEYLDTPSWIQTFQWWRTQWTFPLSRQYFQQVTRMSWLGTLVWQFWITLLIFGPSYQQVKQIDTENPWERIPNSSHFPLLSLSSLCQPLSEILWLCMIFCNIFADLLLVLKQLPQNSSFLRYFCKLELLCSRLATWRGSMYCSENISCGCLTE